MTTASDQNNQEHPLVTHIKAIGKAVGLSLSDAKVGQEQRPPTREEIHARMQEDEEDRQTCAMTSESESVPVKIKGNDMEETTVKLHFVGTPDKPGKPGVRTATFARLILMILEDSGDMQDFEKAQYNAAGDRRISFKVTSPVGERSAAEIYLEKISDRLKQDQVALKNFRALNLKAQLIEEAFSDIENAMQRKTPQFATRVMPRMRLLSDGSMQYGIEIETNHPSLKMQCQHMDIEGLGNVQIPARKKLQEVGKPKEPDYLPGQFSAIVRGAGRRVYDGGQKITATTPQALAELNTVVDALLQAKAAGGQGPQKRINRSDDDGPQTCVS